jgi:hypothetical protein
MLPSDASLREGLRAVTAVFGHHPQAAALCSPTGNAGLWIGAIIGSNESDKEEAQRWWSVASVLGAWGTGLVAEGDGTKLGGPSCATSRTTAGYVLNGDAQR